MPVISHHVPYCIVRAGARRCGYILGAVGRPLLYDNYYYAHGFAWRRTFRVTSRSNDVATAQAVIEAPSDDYNALHKLPQRHSCQEQRDSQHIHKGHRSGWQTSRRHHPVDSVPAGRSRTVLKRNQGVNYVKGKSHDPQAFIDKERIIRDGKQTSRESDISGTGFERRLRNILSRCIRSIPHGTQLKELDFLPLSPQKILLLRSRGYSSEDLWSWMDILTASSSDAAVQKLTTLQKPPACLVVLLARRTHFTRASFNGLVSFILRNLDQKPNKTPQNFDQSRLTHQIKPEFVQHANSDSIAPGMALPLWMELIDQLLRHARLIAPDKLSAIAQIFLQTIGRDYDMDLDVTGETQKQISLGNHFNELLRLLSIPTSLNPKYSATSQEKAQFAIVREMTSRKTPLHISREGYQALVRVQLVRKKTSQEQDWAYLKKLSWPPWKEDKTGMDADKGPEYGVSRAHQILQWMQQAGYAMNAWEKAAMILAGWDTDGSPTIQTRTSLSTQLSPSSLKKKLKWHENKHLEWQQRVQIWAHRVTATRTVREAWACFLSYKSSETRYSQHVYKAMFEKILYSRAEDQSSSAGISSLSKQQNVLPGDAKEPFQEPMSPQEIVYLTKPVASPSQFIDEMLSERIRPTGRFLELLLRKLRPSSLVLKILASCGDLYDGAIAKFLVSPSTVETGVVPDYIFSALLEFMTDGDFQVHDWPCLTPGNNGVQSSEELSAALLETAILMLCAKKPRYAPAWANVVAALAAAKSLPTISLVDKRLPFALRRYLMVETVTRQMQEQTVDVDPKVFCSLCRALRGAAEPTDKGMEQWDAEFRVHVGACLSEGRLFLRQQFQLLTGTSTGTGSLLTNDDHHLLYTPYPHLLHTYARALGMLRDYEGLYSLTSFLVQHRDQIADFAQEQANGNMIMERVLVYLRAVFEDDRSDSVLEAIGSPEEIEPLVKGQVEVLTEWGGWPSDSDVQLYLQTGVDHWERAR